MGIEKLHQFTSQLKPWKWSLKERILLGIFSIFSFLVPFLGVEIIWTDNLGAISVVVFLVFLVAMGLPIVLWVLHKSIMRGVFAILNIGLITLMLFLSLEGVFNLLVEQVGTDINADVLQTYIKTGGKPGKRYFIEYQFKYEGDLYKRTQEVSSEKYLVIQTADKTSVKYIKLLPNISALRDDYFAKLQIEVFIGICLFLECLLYSVMRKNEITNPVLAKVI